MTTDALGDRMKSYEVAEAGRRFMPMVPVIARIDGKCFSAWTKDLERPFDPRMSRAMFDTAWSMARETNPLMAYTQSDEINLVWLQSDFKSEIFHAGKIHKMTSVLASMATAYFERHSRFHMGAERPVAFFDCRTWQVPNETEAANTILWREIDATKNSVSMACRSVCSHKEMEGKGRADQMDMLMKHGINWNDYPPFFKRGQFIQRRTRTGRFTPEEIECLPPLHDARKDPEAEFKRSEFSGILMPPFGRVTNRVEVIFDGAEPAVEVDK